MHHQWGSHIHLGLLFHNHQPAGNFSWICQHIYEQSYLPLVLALERHPLIHVSLHYTGFLLDWLEEHHPDFLTRVAVLAQRGQVEIVGGGYYEPALPSIPDADKVGQIRRLTAAIQRLFGVEAHGMWLAERIWEPDLPRSMRQADMEWTILDDVHFKNAGLSDNDLYGYYMTDDHGSPLKVFSTNHMLRYSIPWRPVAEIIEKLRTLATLDGERLLVMGDDGEKFGSWPGTQTYCWGENGQQGWMEEFFSALEQHSTWLHTTPLSTYAQKHTPRGQIYLPASAYVEMNQWALPTTKAHTFEYISRTLEEQGHDDMHSFLRGGFWRNFLVKYPEANIEHKKMLRVHDLVYAAGGTEEAGLIDLWRSQDNDTYWHGVFGCIYWGHLRSASFTYLIHAQKAADCILHSSAPWQHYEFSDFNRDGHTELLIESDQQNLYLDLHNGGTLFEWDLRRSANNMCCVLARREESYHQQLRILEHAHTLQTPAVMLAAAQSTSTPQQMSATTFSSNNTPASALIVDHYCRSSLIDHFLHPAATLADMLYAEEKELGDFIGAPYTTNIHQDAQGIHICLERDGFVQQADGAALLPLHLSKEIFLPIGEEKLSIHYTLHNNGQVPLQTLFASEWNLYLQGELHELQPYCIIPGDPAKQEITHQPVAYPEIQAFHTGSKTMQQDLHYQADTPMTLWTFPIETIASSEAGLERTYQGSCYLLTWPLSIPAQDRWQVTIHCIGRDVA